MQGHYVYTPRELTQWCLSLLRYNLNDLKDNSSVDGLLEIWAYEAYRLFQDRLVDDVAKQAFDTIITSVLQDDWRTNAASKIKGNSLNGRAIQKQLFVR
jgi:dynein heavy chain 2